MRTLWVALVVASALVLAGCSGEDPAGGPTPIATGSTPAVVATPTATPTPKVEKPKPKAKAPQKLSLDRARSELDKAYEDLDWALSRSDLKGCMAFYQVPFIDEGKKLDEAGLRKMLQELFLEMRDLDKQVPGTVRFSAKTKINKLTEKDGKYFARIKASFTARALKNDARVVLSWDCTDVWRRVDGKWKCCEVRDVSEVDESSYEGKAKPKRSRRRSRRSRSYNPINSRDYYRQQQALNERIREQQARQARQQRQYLQQQRIMNQNRRNSYYPGY